MATKRQAETQTEEPRKKVCLNIDRQIFEYLQFVYQQGTFDLRYQQLMKEMESIAESKIESWISRLRNYYVSSLEQKITTYSNGMTKSQDKILDMINKKRSYYMEYFELNAERYAQAIRLQLASHRQYEITNHTDAKLQTIKDYQQIGLFPDVIDNDVIQRWVNKFPIDKKQKLDAILKQISSKEKNEIEHWFQKKILLYCKQVDVSLQPLEKKVQNIIISLFQ